MSKKDMFRKEQRFSFRKFSFGLASALIANVIFGGAIANSPVVHANTAIESSTVKAGEAGPAQASERSVSLSYVVNLVDQAGQTISVQTKTLDVTSSQATATASVELAADLVPEGYTAVSGLGQVTVTEAAENVFTVVVEKVAVTPEHTEDVSTDEEVKGEEVLDNTKGDSADTGEKVEGANEEQAAPVDKTNLEQLISEANLLIPEGEKKAKDNAELTAAVQAAKPVLASAQAVFVDPAATGEQVVTQETDLRTANQAIGDQLALLTEDGNVKISLNVNNTNGRTNLHIRTDYIVSWDKASVDRIATNPATNANYRPDAGLSWVRDEHGNKALVYKYNMSNPTAFISEDVLKLLKATPTDPAQRTLLGTEKAKVEVPEDGYEIQNQAYSLNGTNIQLLDITDTNNGWGKVNAAQTKVKDLSETERTQFTIPATNGVGDVTVTANGNEKFLSYSKLMLVNTNMPVSNAAIRGNYINSTTQTNLYNVYLVGYKEVDIPTIGDLPNQVNGQYVNAKNGDPRAFRIVPLFGNVTGTTETEPGGSGAPVVNLDDVTKTYRITLPEGEDFLIKYRSIGDVISYTMDDPNSLVLNPLSNQALRDKIDPQRNSGEIIKENGKITGKFQWGAGDVSGYRIAVRDASNTTTLAYSDPVYFLSYTDRLKPNEPGLEAASATQLTKEMILNKLSISTTVHPNGNPDLVIDPSNYTRTIVGYREVTHTKTNQGVTKARGTTENLSDTTLNTLSAGKNYEIRVKTTNVHGQTIYNWVPVNIYQLEAIKNSEKRKFTDFEGPVHAIVELGSAGDVAAVKLKAALSSDFNLANFNISKTAAADLTKRNLEFVKATEVGADGTVGKIRTKDNGNGKVEYTGTGNLPYVFTYSYPDGPDADTNPESVDFTYTILYKDTQTPTVTPEAEYVRIVGEGYTISVPGTDNAYLQPGQLNGSLDIYSNNVRFGGSSVRTNLGVTSLSTELDVSGKDTSGGSDDQSGGSTKFKVKIEGTAPTTAGTGTYYLRVGDGNYPAGPEGAKAAENPGISEENVKVTPITITFVDRLKPITPIPVTNQASLTPAEKAAVIQAVKDANPNNNKLQALPETAFTVNSDGSVSVNYGDNNVNGVTTSLSGATVPLTQVKEESKQAIEDEKTRQLDQIEADKQAEIAKIKANPDLNDAQKEAAENAINAAANKAAQDVTDAANTAKANIDNAADPAAAEKAKTNGLTAITNKGTAGKQSVDLEGAKATAKDDIDDALENEKTAIEAAKQADLTAIDNNPNLTPAQREAAKQAVEDAARAAVGDLTDAANTAKANIDAADSPAAVSQAKKAGEDALALEAAQAAATNAINDAQVAKTADLEAKRKADLAAIEAANLTDAEKQAAKDALNKTIDDTIAAVAKEATDAKADVAAATSPADVATKQGEGLAAINTAATTTPQGAQPLDQLAAKVAATDAINDKLAAEKEAIEAKRDAEIKAITENPDYTDDAAKQAAINAIKQAASNTLTALNNAADTAKQDIATQTTPEKLESAKITGLDLLGDKEDEGEAAIDLIVAKTAATDAIADKLAAEKAALETKRAADLAAIEEANLTPAEEEAAKKALNDTINAAIGDLERQATAAKAEIAAADTPEAVTTAKTNGETALTNAAAAPSPTLDLLAAKVAATDAINDKLAAEKEALESKRAAAIAAIEEANLTPAEEEAAKKALNDTIDAAIGDLETKATEAKAKIAAADAPEAVTTAKTNGETALTNAAAAPSPTLDLLAAKVAATDAINDKLDAEKQAIVDKRDAEIKAITNNPDYTDEAAKQAAIDAINQEADDTLTALKDAATTAKQEIAAQTSPADVESKKSEGIDDLTGIEDEGEAAIDLIVAKTEATDAIADKLADEVKELEAKQAEAEKAIDASTMTPEEKLAAKAELQKVVNAEKAKLAEEAKKATDAIGAADTPAKVADAKLEGVVALTEAGTKAEAAVELAKDKELAKEAIRTEAEEATKAAEKLAEDAIKAINDNPNLSDAEKQAEIDKVTDATAAALDAIAENADKATAAAEKAKVLADLEAAKKAQKDADKAAIDTATPLVEDAVLEAAKQDAVNKLEKDAAQAAKDIAANPNLTADQVKKALEDLAADLKAAKDDVASQTSPAAVQVAEDKGVAAIAEDVLEAAQLDALNKLAKDEKATIAAIESNPNLTPEEKAAAHTKAEALADKAKSDILTAKTPAAVQTIEETADKALAKVEIKAAADDAKKAIAANPNLTGDEKAAAQAKVDAAVTAANTAIDGASSPAAIDAAVLTGEKAAAKEEVKAAADDAKKAIVANPNLTGDEKVAAQAKVDAAVTAANTAIDGASSPAAIEAAVLTGEKAAAKEEVKAAAQDAIKAIKENPNLTEAEKAVAVNGAEAIAKAAVDAIEDPATSSPAAVNAATLAGEKALAREEVRVAAEDAKKAIDANVNLSDAEKALAKSAVDSAVTTANAAIDGATNPATINTATLVGEKAIAKAEVVAAAEDAKKAIAANTNLTAAEKAAAQAKVDAAVTAANTAIDGATSPAAVNTATLAGEKAIAKEEVRVAAEDAKKAIAANTNLTAAEKAAAQAKVDAAVTAANTAIDGASSSAAVNTAILAGEKAIAKEEVKAAADDAKKAIDAETSLTAAEKAAAKTAVDAEVAKTNDAIDAGSTAAAVDTATLIGEKVIAKKELQAAADDAKKAIDSNPNLTDAEKSTAKAAVDSELNKATTAVDTSLTADAVDAATVLGEQEFAKDVLDAAKQDAKNKLAADAAAAKEAIATNPNLSDAEKQAAQAKVDASVTAATTAIAGSTTPAQAQTAEDKGVAAISENVLDAAKQDAKNKLAADAAAAKTAIDANPNLSDAEKAAAKAAVDASVAAANAAIDASTNPSETQAVEDKGVAAISENVLDAAKQDAKNKLAADAAAAKAAIDANPNLSDAEKAVAKDAVDASVAAANAAIDASTNPSETQAVEDKGVVAIAEDLLEATKQGAKNKVMEEAEKAKAAIDANPNLTPEEKAAAKAEIDKAVEAAIISINGASALHGLGEIKLPLATLTVPVVEGIIAKVPGSLTEEENARIKALIEEKNAFPAGTEIIVAKDGSVTIKYPDATVDTVPSALTVLDVKHGLGTSHSLPAYDLKADDDQDAFTNEEELLAGTNPADATSTPEFETQHGAGATHSLPAYDLKLDADKDGFTNGEELTAGTNPADATSKPATKSAKQLPNTGEKATSATSLGLAVLGMGLALFAAKRKKEDEA